MSRGFVLVLSLIVSVLSASGSVAAPIENRIALVIGNSRYGSVPVLANPARDAERMAAALRSAGFQSVTVVSDANRASMIAALNRFSDAAETADWALIYYAGHGIEVGGMNYLVPVDARLKSDRDIGDEGIPLQRVLDSIETAKKLRVVILDACRDNPFINAMRRTAATRSVGRGLAKIEPEGGTLVAYAAKHGQTALDGEDGNSPYVASLARRLGTPGVEINKLFRLVRDDVLAATAKQQEPFVYGSLPGEDFYFVSANPVAKPAEVAPQLEAKLPGAPVSASPQKPEQLAALPPVQIPGAPASGSANPLVKGPLVNFTRSNSGRTAAVSLPEAAIAIAWRQGETGSFAETALLDVIDQRTGRRLPSPTFQLDADTRPATIYVAYVDPNGTTVGPFPIPFEPRAALARENRNTLEMIAGSWLSFRDFNGVLLYYTSVLSYRCGIKQLRIGLDKPEPDRVIPLPPCDEKDPYAIPSNAGMYLKVPPGTKAASAQIDYADGTTSAVKLFKR